MNATPIEPITCINGISQRDPFDAAIDIATDAQGNYILAWIRQIPGEPYNKIFARRYQSDGIPIDAEDVWINSDERFRCFNANSVSVSMTTQRNYAITWTVDYAHGEPGGFMYYTESTTGIVELLGNNAEDN